MASTACPGGEGRHASFSNTHTVHLSFCTVNCSFGKNSSLPTTPLLTSLPPHPPTAGDPLPLSSVSLFQGSSLLMKLPAGPEHRPLSPQSDSPRSTRPGKEPRPPQVCAPDTGGPPVHRGGLPLLHQYCDIGPGVPPARTPLPIQGTRASRGSLAGLESKASHPNAPQRRTARAQQVLRERGRGGAAHQTLASPLTPGGGVVFPHRRLPQQVFAPPRDGLTRHRPSTNTRGSRWQAMVALGRSCRSTSSISQSMKLQSPPPSSLSVAPEKGAKGRSVTTPGRASAASAATPSRGPARPSSIPALAPARPGAPSSSRRGPPPQRFPLGAARLPAPRWLPGSRPRPASVTRGRGRSSAQLPFRPARGRASGGFRPGSFKPGSLLVVLPRPSQRRDQ